MKDISLMKQHNFSQQIQYQQYKIYMINKQILKRLIKNKEQRNQENYY